MLGINGRTGHLWVVAGAPTNRHHGGRARRREREGLDARSALFWQRAGTTRRLALLAGVRRRNGRIRENSAARGLGANGNREIPRFRGSPERREERERSPVWRPHNRCQITMWDGNPLYFLD